jgi:signal transduction histidine kinase
VVEGARRWVPAPCAGRIRIEVDDRHASDVLASPGQLQQVLVHLVSNACKAIPPGRTGRVIIRLQPGPPGFSRIEVVDDGVGMAPEVLARVFDPFFTTREVGQGMGLGLSLSHAIVEGFGGALTATSAPGAGTVMRVDLPVAA